MINFTTLVAHATQLKAIISVQDLEFNWHYLSNIRFETVEEYGSVLMYELQPSRKNADKIEFYDEVIGHLLAEGWRVSVELVEIVL